MVGDNYRIDEVKVNSEVISIMVTLYTVSVVECIPVTFPFYNLSYIMYQVILTVHHNLIPSR